MHSMAIPLMFLKLSTLHSALDLDPTCSETAVQLPKPAMSMASSSSCSSSACSAFKTVCTSMYLYAYLHYHKRLWQSLTVQLLLICLLSTAAIQDNVYRLRLHVHISTGTSKKALAEALRYNCSSARVLRCTWLGRLGMLDLDESEFRLI